MAKIKWVLILCLFGFIFNRCGSTPTTPEPSSTNRATYAATIQVTGTYLESLDQFSFDWVYAVTNTNGIGATVLRVELFLYHGTEKFTAGTLYPQVAVRIEANQTYTWKYLGDTRTNQGFRYDQARAYMYVQDDKGYETIIYNPDPVSIVWSN